MNVPLTPMDPARHFFIFKTFTAALFLFEGLNLAHSLRLTNMSAPLIADPRDDMYLDCRFDMGAEVLYAVKWYKDENEFFRYMPHQSPHTFTYPVAGVHMVHQSTSCGQSHCKVRLTDLTRDHSGGAYRCEVSSEAPAFRLASETHNVTVAALPREDPKITGLADSYSLGDVLTAECSSAPADPTPVNTWYINSQPARQDVLGEASTSHPNELGLAARNLPLRFVIERRHLQGNVMHLRCESKLPSVPMPAQSVGRTIIVKTLQPQVNNQKLHWSNSSSQHFVSKAAVIFILLVVRFYERRSC